MKQAASRARASLLGIALDSYLDGYRLATVGVRHGLLADSLGAAPAADTRDYAWKPRLPARVKRCGNGWS